MYHRCTHVSLSDSCFIVFNVSFHVVTKQSQGTSDSNEPNFSFQQRLGHLVPGCRAHSMIKKGSRKLAEKCPFPCPVGPMVEVLQDQRVFEAPSNCQWTHPIKDLKLKLLLLLLGQLPQASNPKVLGTWTQSRRCHGCKSNAVTTLLVRPILSPDLLLSMALASCHVCDSSSINIMIDHCIAHQSTFNQQQQRPTISDSKLARRTFQL